MSDAPDAGTPGASDASRPSPRLARRLGLGDAVFIGLGSMIGAGVFSVFAPAAAAAGGWLLAGHAIAALVALCNATSSAQLAAEYPTSGGTYVYGRERLGEWWGFVAGWSFVIGKIASCAAMALTFATYAVPEDWQKPVAALAVVALAAVNYRGVTRTARLTRIVVVITLVVLAVVVVSGAVSVVASGATAGVPTSEGLVASLAETAPTPYGILQSAALLFFAFAGYARIATMGEEVRDPASTIPRAILISLAITVLVYAAVAVAVLGSLGPAGVAASSAPLVDTVQSSGWRWAEPIVRIGASAASLGALLGLIAGIGRTTLAMAREGDLPRGLAAVHPRFRVPHRAEVAIAAVVVVLVLVADLRTAIGFSAFGVLLYYAVANLAAFTQREDRRLYPRAFQVLGTLLCVVLVSTLPPPAIVTGAVVVAVGVVYRLVVRRIGRDRTGESTRVR